MEQHEDSDNYESATEIEPEHVIRSLRRKIPKRQAPQPPLSPKSNEMPGFVTEFKKSDPLPPKKRVLDPRLFVSHPIVTTNDTSDVFSNLESFLENDRKYSLSNEYSVPKSFPTNEMEYRKWDSPINSYEINPTYFQNRNIMNDLPMTGGHMDLALKYRNRPISDSVMNYDKQNNPPVLPSLEECKELDSVSTPRYPVPLDRSDSIVTVAHLYEDLIVSNRFKIKVTLTNLTVVVVLAAILLPNFAAVLFGSFRLIFGTLFPAYYSYKAVRTKNVKEYVKWMMYWIVFAFFTCIETVTDVFLAFWFPFYYEIKILVVLWLLSPATRGSSILYRKFVHPWLIRREDEIDDCISKAKHQGYSAVVELGTKGVNYATSIIMQTAIKGGGGLVSQLKRSYSASDVGEEADMNRNIKALSSRPYDETDFMAVDEEEEFRYRSGSESTPRRGHSMGRSTRATKVRSTDMSEIYKQEIPETTQRRSPRTHDMSNSVTGVGTTTNSSTRKSRSDGTAYATLPRTRRTTTKKKQI